ncbi:hypothetical protein [Paraburkholderia sp.]|uniref:hypothetical protein n=1 Tax=Paraburkholderia sp. TaxID=1926495 RepID=UPI0025FB6383|nr:hypothetical protein [Paraburkholderia sp.]
MRLNHLIVRRPVTGGTAALTAFTAFAAAALLGLAPAVRAQTPDNAANDAAGTPATQVRAAASADVIPATLHTLSAPALIPAALDTSPPPTDSAHADTGALAEDSTPPADDPVVAGSPLDDQTLAHQRGGAVGMVMVAATPQLMRGGGSVTLWDEIAPPAPLPIPVDNSQAAQGNIANYTRK